MAFAESQSPTREQAAAGADLALLGELTVPGARGPVPLRQVAELSLTSGPAQIDRYDLSMPAMIGMIMLMGIATKNSILLVAYAIVAQREQGLSRLDALLDARHKRARPIVMTTLAMGFGTDPSFRATMAIVVIGGLITSTFLSLLVIPVIYEVVDNFIQRVTRRRTKVQEAPASA